jgi:purine-binding chemotaxis protein CheW
MRGADTARRSRPRLTASVSQEKIMAAAMAKKVPSPERHDQNQYLMFTLGKETFAIPILCIKEILEYSPPTDVPMMPAFVRGIVNLRGAAVPVIDLAQRFGRAGGDTTKKSCIVIVEALVKETAQVFGVVVDAVSEVLEIPDSEIEAPPTFGSTVRTDFIYGMGKVHDRFVVILNVDAALTADEMAD